MADFATIGIRSDTRDLKRGERDLNKFAKTGERTERRVKKSAVGMAGAMNMVSTSAVRMAAVAGGALAGFLTGKMFLGAIREQEQLQRNMLKTQAIITATGGAAGRTAQQLHDQARQLARATLQSTEGIMQAQQVMLTFRHVTGETFDAAIIAAADLSEAIGTDLNSAILQVGKALEDPVTGMTALTRSGTVFTQAQKDMVKEMVRVGDTAGAQMFILGELEKQYGGVATAAAGGLAGVMDSLSQSFQEFNISLANSLGLGVGASSAMTGLTSALDFMAQNMDVIINSAKVAVLWYGGRYVGALVLAKAATITLAGSMAVLRSAMMLTGIGALIIGAGVLVTWFGKLKEGAGGFGSAMGLLGDVATAAWNDMKAGAWGLYLQMAVVVNNIKFAWVAMLRGMSKQWGDFADGLASGMRGMPFMENAANNMQAFANTMSDSFVGYGETLVELDKAFVELDRQQVQAANRTSETVGALAALTAATSGAAEGTDGAASAVEELAENLDDIPDSAGGAAAALTETETAAQKMADTIKGYVVSAVDGIANAFGDFVAGGLKDFKGFVSAVWQSFVSLISQMVALAAKNQIMISLGLGGGGGAGGVGGAVSGALGGLMGGFGAAATGTTAAVAGSGLLGGLGASLGIGGAAGAGGGIFAIGANAALAGGGIMATVGAALPLIGIGFALWSIFKKKPAISKEDFAAIQTGLGLTGMALFNTGKAGQKMAADLLKSFGSIENFTKATESYYSNFFTAEEKLQKAADGIEGVFDELGMGVPATAAAFREIVEAQDLTTQSGRDTYASLLQVSEAFAQVYGGVNNVTGALTALNASVGGSIFSTLVDERRAAAYLKNGIAFDAVAPDRAGGGIAYRGTGPRIVAKPQAEIDLDKQVAVEAEKQTQLMIIMAKVNKRMLEIYDQWEVIGLPPERV